MLVADLPQQADHAVRRHLEAGGVEDLRADVRVDAYQFERVQAQHPAHRLGRVPAAQGETELLVLVRGGDELVGVRLDADRDADLHPLPPAQLLRGVRHPDDLLERVHHDPPHPGLDGLADLLRGLVVAVQRDPVGRHPRGQRNGQFPAGAHVEVEPLLVQPAHHGAGQERLARVEDVGVRAEGLAPGTAAGPEVGLVQDVGGGAELLRETADVQSADGGDALGVPGDGTGPDPGSRVFRSAGGAA